mmetsp:Transcript_16223/g.19897  ORF Transcript_16223/g.19897 Transcript_16223/m.19897 type:complete len:233 (-) Transcript_16223:50-748(-)
MATSGLMILLWLTLGAAMRQGDTKSGTQSHILKYGDCGPLLPAPGWARVQSKTYKGSKGDYEQWVTDFYPKMGRCEDYFMFFPPINDYVILQTLASGNEGPLMCAAAIEKLENTIVCNGGHGNIFDSSVMPRVCLGTLCELAISGDWKNSNDPAITKLGKEQRWHSYELGFAFGFVQAFEKACWKGESLQRFRPSFWKFAEKYKQDPPLIVGKGRFNKKICGCPTETNCTFA